MIPRRSLASRAALLLRGLSWPERVAAVIVAGAMAFGLYEFGSGIYIKIKAQVAQILLERAWARARAGEAEPRPWPWADTWPVARIMVPRIGRSAVILAGTSGEAMAFGPGYMTGTPLPGMPGTGIISGHRDTHFTFLRDLIDGDLFTIRTADGRDHAYRVTGAAVVRADQSGIDPFGPGRGIALVTCYPFDSYSRGPERYVVRADEILQPARTSARAATKGIGDPLRLPEIRNRDVLAVVQTQDDAAGAEQAAER